MYVSCEGIILTNMATNPRFFWFSQTLKGAKKHNILMGHVCEERSVKHPTQHTNDFEDSLLQWVEVFIGQEYPKSVARWQLKIQSFSEKIRVCFILTPRRQAGGNLH